MGLHGGFRGDEWFAHRIEIFKNFTLKSLLNQTNKHFVLWLSFRPQEWEHPYLKELETYIAGLNAFPAIFTYDGLMYWDDKFSGRILDRIKNFARIIRDSLRYKRLELESFKEIFRNKNQTLSKRLESALDNLSSILPKVDWIYLTRIDSDDLFHKDAVTEIQNQSPEYRRVFIYKNGYVYNSNTQELAEWNPPTNPPFHTIIFPSDVFLTAKWHLSYLDGFRSHEDIPKLFNCKQLTDGRYCVLIHQRHVSTIWKHPFQGKMIEDKTILKDFGI